MKITTAWLRHEGETEIISCYDEFQFEDWGGVPEFHTDAIGKHDLGGEIRELVIVIPDHAISNLFHPTQVEGKVV